MNTDLIKKLAEKRKKLEGLKAERAAMLLAVTETPKYKGLDETVKTLARQLDETDADIRKIALDEYATYQNKKPGNGIEIKVFKVATILDPDRAREWSLHNFTPALKLDESAFKKAAIAGTIPPTLATVEEEARAQIATDLSEYLPDPNICQTTGKPIAECECEQHRMPF